jgi:hypothetical protein
LTGTGNTGLTRVAGAIATSAVVRIVIEIEAFAVAVRETGRAGAVRLIYLAVTVVVDIVLAELVLKTGCA